MSAVIVQVLADLDGHRDLTISASGHPRRVPACGFVDGGNAAAAHDTTRRNRSGCLMNLDEFGVMFFLEFACCLFVALQLRSFFGGDSMNLCEQKVMLVGFI